MRSVGDLRTRVMLQKRVTQVQGGESTERWQTLGLYAAEVLHASAKDFYRGGGTYLETGVTIHLRTPQLWTPAPGLRCVHQGAAYDVVEVVPDKPLRGFTELRAVRVEMEGSGCEM